ncbi:ATP-binding protein [Aeromonas sp. 23P]|uniref:ATP-binding protein n=1 Tax=Aeromonas sp. 23P TaxID=3452716 RepID=UPI003F7A89E7
MADTSLAQREERRKFQIHPAIIKSIINEQAGSITKAFAELVMNAIDAEATRIDIEATVDGKFRLIDNGKGFTSREEIETFFETFGSPHVDGDAKYGRFRIGRGQIMSYARTVWRSGKFEMRVDLESDGEFFGYDLIEHEDEVVGCTITGETYRVDAYLTLDELLGSNSEYYCSDGLENMVRYVSIPVFVNGNQINELPESRKWDFEDDSAWYLFDRKGMLQIYNLGVYVCNIEAKEFGVGGIVVSKRALSLNMARNTVVIHKCDVWGAITTEINNRFSLRLEKTGKLTDPEVARLLRELAFGKKTIEPHIKKNLRTTKFIKDVFGQLKTPDDVVSGDLFTLYDGKHMAIAERVQSSGLAVVIMPETLEKMGANVTLENVTKFVDILVSKLGYRKKVASGIDFSHFVSELSDTSCIIDDEDLKPEQALVLKLLRSINADVACLVEGDGYRTRQLLAGTSDKMLAWTDGHSYIAIDTQLLDGIRGARYGGGPVKLVHVLAHEYAHGESSTGDHAHDYEFYKKYHDAVMKNWFGDITDSLFRKYVAGIARLEIVPSADHRSHIKILSGWLGKLRSRVKNG